MEINVLKSRFTPQSRLEGKTRAGVTIFSLNHNSQRKYGFLQVCKWKNYIIEFNTCRCGSPKQLCYREKEYEEDLIPTWATYNFFIVEEWGVNGLSLFALGP